MKRPSTRGASASKGGRNMSLPKSSVEARSLAPVQRRLSAIIPVEPRGRHELMRLAAGLAPALPGLIGELIGREAMEMGIAPAHVERVVVSVPDRGIIALVDDALVALACRGFLEIIGVRLNRAELRVAERIENAGDLVFYVVSIARGHCLGVIGVPNVRALMSAPEAH